MNKYTHAAVQFQGNRARQEDVCDFFLQDDAVLAVLADGMGGHPGGMEAAQIAVKEFIAAYSKEANRTNSIPPLSVEMLNAANDAIAHEVAKNRSLANMGCTLIAALIYKNKIEWISVGDSLLYLFSDNQLTKLNASHTIESLIAKMNADDKENEEIFSDNINPHALYSAVTGNPIPNIDQNNTPFSSGVVVLASDGLLTLTEQEIRSCLSVRDEYQADNITHDLLEQVKAQNAQHQDNVSILAIAYN